MVTLCNHRARGFVMDKVMATKVDSGARLFDVSDKIESIVARAMDNTLKERVKTLDGLDNLLNTINMVKRELSAQVKQEVVDNGWYDALNLDKRNLRKYI